MNSEASKSDSTATTENQSEQVEQPAPSKIVEEFQYLLDKSHQLFSGLKDLPLTASYKTWYPYFQKSFEVFTKLWKFQQQHRKILENKEYFGLKRYEIGEIASKIGQLYYHYYLRTSETNYLQEAFVFYEAIRERSYFRDVMETKNPGLMIKRLRYYARYIVVCLLLNRKDLVKKLTEEMYTLIEEYIEVYQPTDASEWKLVAQEIVTFLDSDKKLPVDNRGAILAVPCRLQTERSARYDKDGSPRLRLQEAVLVGSCHNQVKFSELTLDVYRMLQSLEREPLSNKPSDTTQSANSAVSEVDDPTTGNQTNQTGDKSTRRGNPHKYLLYNPVFSQLFLYLTTAFKDINENMALLLYLSADGTSSTQSTEATAELKSEYISLFSGGAMTATRRDAVDSIPLNCVHPADLIPFSRKPLFVIVDSNASHTYMNFPKIFGPPSVFLLSPTEYPSIFSDNKSAGSIFTLFLHSPLLGFSIISEVTQSDPETWGKCLSFLGMWESKVAEMVNSWEGIDKAFKRFMQDDFLRQFIVRFVITKSIFLQHKEMKTAANFPQSHPPMPESLFTAPEMVNSVKELSRLLGSKLYDANSDVGDSIKE
ncbi:protein SCAI [Paraphysoderma sedebokerense]|nr:protein SCAI [Paraphysoderma sedebokerense]